MPRILLQTCALKRWSTKVATELHSIQAEKRKLRLQNALKRRCSSELLAPCPVEIAKPAKIEQNWTLKQQAAASPSWPRRNVKLRPAFTAMSDSAPPWSPLEPSPPMALCAALKRLTISTESDGHPCQLALKSCRHTKASKKWMVSNYLIGSIASHKVSSGKNDL